MGIVSYAQNFEDVILWRALKDIKDGFYIDVGANHPTIDSVTKAFYENGWKGINIEPEFELYELLKEDRPRDLNLNVAISSKIELVEFFVSSIRGWSTTNKKSLINLQKKDSFSETRIIQAISLDKLCEDNIIKEIHFLKVDVEGAEKDVLKSFSFNKVRPWICIVEATKPTTQIDVSIEWENILIDNKYIFAYFDGLNKYYVAKEHEKLVDILKIPPNVFDEFILAGHRDAIIKAKEAEEKIKQTEKKIKLIEKKVKLAEAKAKQAEEKVKQVEEKARQAKEKVKQVEEKARQAEANYISILNSNSWKITKPLRLFRKFIKWFRTGVYHWITFSPSSRPRRIVKKILIFSKLYINKHPNLKNKFLYILNKFPIFKSKLQWIINEKQKYATSNQITEEILSPRAKVIYEKLSLQKRIEK